MMMMVVVVVVVVKVKPQSLYQTLARVPECFKDDYVRQRKSMDMWEIWLPLAPNPPEPMITEFGVGDEDGDPYQYAKFHYDP